MSPQEVFTLARQYGIVKPGLVIGYAQLSKMVAEHEAARQAIEDQMESESERRMEEATERYYETRNDPTGEAAEQDRREAEYEAWMFGV